MPNFKKAILSHDKHRKTCICRKREDCLLIANIHDRIYFVESCSDAQRDKQQDAFVGFTEKAYAARCNPHKSFFNLEHIKTLLRLSEHFWELQNNNIDDKIE